MNRPFGIAVLVAVSFAGRAAGTPTTDNPEIAPIPFSDSQPSKAQPKPLAIVAPILAAEAVPVLGKKVVGPNDKDIVGQVVDVLVDKDGKPTAVVIDVGGFLGVGSRKIAVDWQSLTFRPSNHDAPVQLSLDREQVQAAPEYKESGSVTAVVVPPAQSGRTDAPD